MVYLSQLNPKWAKETLGNTNFTIGRWGCTTTGVSMLSDYYKNFKTPAELAKLLKYTDQGLIIWSSVPEILNFKLEKRIKDTCNRTEIETSLKDPKKAVMLEVNYSHWVVALSKELVMGGYNIADPLTGTRRSSRNYKTITGSAHFILK